MPDLTTLADFPSNLAPLYLHLSVTDPETVAALTEATEGRDRQELALTALKIGILSLKAARGTVDGAAIQREGERLLGSLEQRLAGHRATARCSTSSSAACCVSTSTPPAAPSPSACSACCALTA